MAKDLTGLHLLPKDQPKDQKAQDRCCTGGHLRCSKKNKMKPTNPNADTYVKEQKQYLFITCSSEPTCGTPWRDTLRWHSCRTPFLLDTLTWHSCKTLLLDTLAWHSSGTLLLDILVRLSYLTLFWDTLTCHFCKTLLTWHSCNTLVLDTSCSTLL